MNLTDYFNQIEGIRFAAGLGVLSGFKVLLLVLKDDETLKGLVNELRKSPESRQAVLQRIRELLPANPQPEYEHPHDAALAGYLYVLNRTAPDMALIAIEEILQTSQLWWARRLAEHIRETEIIKEASGEPLETIKEIPEEL